MTVLCAGNCHVWLGSSSLCTCEAEKVAMMYGLMQPYNPFGPHAPKPTPPPDVPLHVFQAAQLAGAGYLSTDGKRIYCERLGAILEAEWQGDGFGAWWTCQQIAADAVKM